MKMQRSIQKGSVSLFIVIFSALLTIVIITAFIRIMLQDQMQATANDLSKSALDSANAGVEDAKRAVLHYAKLCDTTTPDPNCTSWLTDLSGNTCDGTQKVLGMTPVRTEVPVGDTSINQAYTCVKVTLNTDDYVDTLSPGTSKVVHLKTEKDASGNSMPYDTVELSWFSRNDLSYAPDSTNGVKLDPINASNLYLKKYSDWDPRTPSLMRAQLLQFGPNFTLTSLDDSTNVTNNNTATLFMTPTNLIGLDHFDFANGYATAPQPVGCDQSFSLTGGTDSYACKATIKLPLPANATSINDRKDAYLRVLAPYNTQTSFRVRLINSAHPSTPVKFGGVQPKVDSTGRADDQFRRVSTRIQQSDFPYVNAALDVTGDLCKTFTVGATSTDFKPGICGSLTSVTPTPPGSPPGSPPGTPGTPHVTPPTPVRATATQSVEWYCSDWTKHVVIVSGQIPRCTHRGSNNCKGSDNCAPALKRTVTTWHCPAGMTFDGPSTTTIPNSTPPMCHA